MVDTNNKISPMLAHSDTINRISFTPNGKYIVSASEDTTVKVWEADSGRLRHTFYALEGGLPLSMDISPDGTLVAVGYGPGDWDCKEGSKFCSRAIILREIQNGKIVQISKGHQYGINSVAFSPDGRQLLSASHYHDENSVILWDLKKGWKMRTYEILSSRGRFISFLPDGKRFVVAGKHNDIALVDIGSGETIRSWKDDGEHFILPQFGALGPDGTKLLLGDDGSDEYMIWDIESGQETWIKTPWNVLSLAPSPDGHIVACGRRNGIDLYRFGSKERVRTFTLPHTNITALAYSPDGKQLAIGSDNNASAYYSVTFQVLDLETGTSRFSLFTPVDSSPFAVCDPDGKHIYTRASGSTIKIWDTASGKEVLRITGDWRDIRYAGISPDGRYLAGALADSDIIKIWDAVTGAEVHSIATGFSDEIEALHFRCGGNKIIALAMDHGPHVFDAKTGRYITSLPGKNLRRQPNFNSSDDRYFAVIGDSGDIETKGHSIITVFDIETSSVIAVFPLPEDYYSFPAALYYTPGITLAALYKWDHAQPEDKQHTITIYNAASREILYTHTAPYINEDAINFSPSGGAFMLSYGKDLHILPINHQGNEGILHIPVNHRSSITHIVYLPDRLLSTSYNAIEIADSKTGKHLQTIAEGTDLCLLPASGDGRFLVTASNSLVKTWDVEKKTEKTAMPVCKYPETITQFPNGKELFFSDDDSEIYRYDTSTGKTMYAFPVSKHSSIRGCSFSPRTEEMILWVCAGMMAEVYNTETGKKLFTIQWKNRINCTAYNHKGNYIVCCGDVRNLPFIRRNRKIGIFDAGTGEEIKKFPRSWDDVCAVAVSHDDRYLVTGSVLHKIVLWDLEEAVAIRTYTGHKGDINMVAFTHDGKRIVSSSDDTTLRIWDRESAACLTVFPGIREAIPESVSNPAWAFIAALTVHGTVKLFSKDTLEEAAHIINFKDGS
jgi:WD40 repeat protein